MFDKLKKYLKDTPRNYVDKPLTNGVQNIPSGAVILTRAKSGIFGYLIRKVTEAWCNHAGIYFGSGRKEMVEALSGGVTKSTLDNYLNSKSQFEVWVKKDLSVMQLAIIKGYAYGCVGKRYDWTDIFGFISKPFRKKESERKMICSELVAMTYNAAGIKTTTKPFAQTSPGDLREYFASEEGKNDRWGLWDSFNTKN